MSSISVSSLVLGSLTVEVDGADASLALSVLGTAPASLTIELGTPGAQGNAATIAVGTTTTLSPGSSATVTNAGTSSAAVFNFGIPQGTTGATGATGPAGPGLPSGGTEGQIVVKNSATDYDTVWQDNFATMLRVNARNETGATLSKGTVVYISGASGNKPTLSKALATGDATSAQTLGIVTSDILTNQNGTVTVRGLVESLDTSAYSAGAQLYLSPTTAGAWTTTKPSAPNHLVYVGIVVRSHANQGSVEVAIQNGYELHELHDVALASEANNDLLAYDTATDLWKNKSASTLGLLTSATAASTYLAKASNLSDLASASTARTNLGLGTMATATASDYLAKADNLSGLASTSTARTNLGLGTAATASSSELVPSGGTTGQVLAKASGTNYDLTWTTASASVAWGGITGTLSSQTDLNTALGLKADLESPTFTTRIYTPAIRNLLNTDLQVDAYNDTGAGTHYLHYFNAYDGRLILATNGGGLTYPDATTQTTAFIDAPSDSTPYVRIDGAWEALTIE